MNLIRNYRNWRRYKENRFRAEPPLPIVSWPILVFARGDIPFIARKAM